MGAYDGKSAVVIGGSTGIGLATARLLAHEGATVLITGRTEDALEAARRQIGATVLVSRSDVASLADLPALVDPLARTELGTVHALHVNAGLSRFVPHPEMTEADFDEIFAVNSKGPYFAVQQLAPVIADGGGVVLTTSVANAKAIPALSAYAASKAALRSMARSLARELLPRGIRVNAVSPGPIDTGALDRSLPADVAGPLKAQMAADNPMGRFGRADEVAKAVAFLAFDATYTTGAELVVDGGSSQL